MHSFHLTTITTTLLLMAGCASTGRPGPSSCTSDLRPHGRSLLEAIDSTTLQQAASAAWQPGYGLVLATLVYDSAGERERITVLADSLPQAHRARLEQLLTGNSRSQALSGLRVDLLLGDDTGPILRRVSRFASCAPTILQRQWLAQQIQMEARRLSVQRPLTVILMVHVQGDGTPGTINIDGSSGDPAFDQAAVGVMRRAAFTPGMIEGIPVVVWARFPISASPAARDTISSD
jgi:TonB family protein